MFDEFVLWFFCADYEEFSVLSAAGDGFVWIVRGGLVWLTVTELTMPRW